MFVFNAVINVRTLTLFLKSAGVEFQVLIVGRISCLKKFVFASDKWSFVFLWLQFLSLA